MVLEQMASSMTDKAGSASLSTMMTEQIDFIFDQVDADGSGKINVYELSDALELMGIRMTRTNILSMMAAVDENCDGEIDGEEFHALVCMAIARSTQQTKRARISLAHGATSSTLQESVDEEDFPSSSRVTFSMDTAQTSRSICNEKNTVLLMPIRRLLLMKKAMLVK